MTAWEDHLDRWERAGLVDAATATNVRTFESQRETPAGRSWQVAVMFALGIILLVGGMMLFVAAHWDNVSPWQRLWLVVAFLVSFHGLGAASAKRFPGMSTTLHGVGTAGAGAAIFTVGIIFNMQEHWPTAVLLWALCAAAGWWLLRDQVQKAMTILLVPTWVVCEWSFRAENYSYSGIYMARMYAVIFAVMLVCFIRSRRIGVFWTLYVVGAVGLVVSTGMLSVGWSGWMDFQHLPMVSLRLRVLSAVIMLTTAICGWLREKRSLLPVATVSLMSYLLPWRPTDVTDIATHSGNPWRDTGPGLLMYVGVAVVCAVLVWWGLRVKSRAVVNYAIAAFAMTVLWFYFGSLLDKLGRSLGLIALGILFLAGGWALEKFRRKLMAGMRQEAV